MREIDIEKLWIHYIGLVYPGRSEKDMPVDQVRELKRAFYGAVGETMMLIADDIHYGGNMVIDTMGILTKQVEEFFADEVGNQHLYIKDQTKLFRGGLN